MGSPSYERMSFPQPFCSSPHQHEKERLKEMYRERLQSQELLYFYLQIVPTTRLYLSPVWKRSSLCLLPSQLTCSSLSLKAFFFCFFLFSSFLSSSITYSQAICLFSLPPQQQVTINKKHSPSLPPLPLDFSGWALSSHCQIVYFS